MSWTNVKLTDLATVSSGGGAPQDADAFSSEGSPFVRAGSLVKLLGGQPEDSLELLQPDVAAAHKLKLFPAGTILFAKSGMSAMKGHVYQLKKPAYVVNHLAALTPHSKCAGDYLRHVLRFKSPTCLIKDEAYPSIRLGDIGSMEVPAPRADSERQRIAAILNQADELRRKRQRAIDRLNQLGQAIFFEMFGDPVENPYGFPAKRLGEIVEFVGGAQPAKSHFLYEDGPDRIRFVQIRDFRTDKYPTFVPTALAKRPFTETDVMIGRYGPPVFQIFRGLSGTYNVALMKAKPKSHMTSDFMFYLLQERRLHSYVVANSERTAGQSGVNLELLEKYPAYAPPAKLLSQFSDRIASLQKQEEASNLAGQRAEALFSSLQHRAFKGKL